MFGIASIIYWSVQRYLIYLISTGEWVAEFIYNGHDKSDTEYQRFAAAQIEVYGDASFGWAYWSYNCIQGHWSIKNMIDKGIINLLN